jgi:Flp pilus assembly protein TadG
MTRRGFRSRFQDERGAVLVIVAAAMFGIVLLTGLVVDTANWFQHQRHLQLQADAGALAGAALFNKCVSDAATANTTIVSDAHRYAGDPTSSSPYNTQVSGDSNIVVRVNSQNYGSAGGDNSETAPSPGGAPCTSGYVDVKATDSNLPWFMFPGIVPSVNTHARVSILQISTLSGSLPLAVEDVNPLQAGAIFVNEDSSNAVLGTQQLTAGATQTLNGQSLQTWSGGPKQVSVSTAHTGVVIALCSNKNLCGNPGNTNWLNGGSVTAICGQLFVGCYSDDGTGLELIRGYNSSGTGSATAAIVRSVTLTSGNCGDDSAPYFLLNGGCNVGVQAQVDFGTTTDPSRSVANGGLNASVKVGGCTLAYTGSTGTTSSWSVSNCPTVASGAGQDPLNLIWSTTAGGSHTVLDVARPFANDGPPDDQSYPIAYAELSQGAGCAGGGANSVPFGSTSICVGIGLINNLKNAADASDPTRILKFITQGSHTGAVDCGGGNLRDQIANGCTTRVQRNPGEACPNATVPVDCLREQPGQAVGQVRQGMNQRWVPNNVCPPNNWTAASGSLPNIPNGDTRVVPLIITLYGAFTGNGAHYVPVTDFGAFYVTGWDGAPNSCNGINQPAPPGAGNGTIWGHFIKYLGDFGSSTATAGCDYSALAPCITVMTR